MVEQNFELKEYNTFGLNCQAKYFTSFESIDALQTVISDKKFESEKKLILGGGSNILLTKNFDGLVLHNQIKGFEILEENESFVKLKIGAGENWHQTVLKCIEHAFGGIENLSLIPGKVGASPIQNIGAYGVELKDVFEELTAVNIVDQTLHQFNAEECLFGYRDSIFKQDAKGKYVICNVVLNLTKNKHKYNISYGAIEKKLEESDVKELSLKVISDSIIHIRNSKLPNPDEIGNSGSFFKNPIVEKEKIDLLLEKYPQIPFYNFGEKFKLAAGWLIEKCGFKGIKNGNTGTYEKQALVLVNHGNATGKEIFDFSEKIIDSVNEKYNVQLEREVNVI